MELAECFLTKTLTAQQILRSARVTLAMWQGFFCPARLFRVTAGLGRVFLLPQRKEKYLVFLGSEIKN